MYGVFDFESYLSYNNIRTMERIRSIFDRFKPKQSAVPQPQVEIPAILAGPDTLVKPPARRFFDEAAAAMEVQELYAELGSAYEGIGTAIIMTSPKDAARFNALRDKIDNCAAISSIHSDRFREVDSTGGDMDMSSLGVLHVLALGTSLVTHNAIREQVTIARRQGFAEGFEPFAAIYEFSAASELAVKIGGISLTDFLAFRSKQDSPVPYLNFLVTGSLINFRESHPQILAQNQSPLNARYPNIAISTIEVIPHKIAGLLSAYPDVFSHPSERLLLSEMSREAGRLAQAVLDVTTVARSLVVNPTSPNFPALRDQMLAYLTQDRTGGIVVLNTIISGRPNHLFELYRKAKQFSVNGNNSVFYQTLIDALKDFVEEGSRITTILTKDDVVGILDLDSAGEPESFQVSTFEQLNKQIGLILTKSSRRSYAVDPDNIEWHNLVKPQSVDIEFDPGRPKKFTVTLSFDNDLGEAIDLRFTLDTQKNTLDWVLLEDPMVPEDQEVASLRSALVRTSTGIMRDVQIQVEDEFNLKQAAKTQGARASQPLVQRAKRERNDDPIYQLRKQMRAAEKTEPGITSSLEMEVAATSIRNHVSIPDTKELEDKLRYISHVDKEIIKAALLEYDERGTGGKFTRKKKLGLDGTPRYTLSIGCTVPKGVRVLLKEQASVNGARTFEIIDIRYRKDIYRLNDL